MSGARVGIVGGGILGLTSAYRLLQAGAEVAVFERSTDLGGLVGAFDFDGHRVDRFYHVILPTDDRVRGLAEELGLGDRFRFRPTGVGFYDDGRLCSMNSLREFLTFPLLAPHDRLRLAAFVLHCQRKSVAGELDETPLEDWLRAKCGKRTVERLWRPLLDSKFDGQFDDLPATYLWARTRRMSKTRDSSGREIMGWLEGGYETLITALVARIRELGGEINAGVSVEQIASTNGRADGLVVDGTLRPFDLVLSTLVPPVARKLLSPELAMQADACYRS
jgi:protoporphyrinogen oxidase